MTSQYREDIEIPESVISDSSPDFRTVDMACHVAWCRYTSAERESLSTRAHKHQMYEIHYVRTGQLRFLFSEGKNLILKAEQYLIIPPDQTHGIENESKDTVKFVAGFQLDTDRINSLFNKEHLLKMRVINASHSLCLMADALLEKQQLPFMASASIASLVNSLILSAVEDLLGKQSSGEVKNSERAARMMEYIREQVHQNLSPDQVAGHFGITVRHMNRISVQFLNKTVNEMINEEKMKWVRWLLTKTTYSLTDIAMASGFSDEYSFSRFFRRFAGMPPGKYRNTHKTDEKKPAPSQQ